MAWQRREDQEDRELRVLSPHATASRNAGGRRLFEAEDPLRTAFQRDRDRVLHSSAFRRMQHKTQVMAAFEGDHYRSRMTHSLEVSQMSRGVARALRLNEDLAEAIALAHDLGHPPFGHVGEEALDEAMRDHGGFRHNAQGVRIVDYLEGRYERGYGLNLTLAVRRSLLKGRIPTGFPLSQDLLPKPAVPIEAHLVDQCDKIAYLSHDLDDGLRANLFTEDDAAELRLWQAARLAAGSDTRQRIVSELTSLLIHDLVEHADVELTGARTDTPPRLHHGAAIAVQAQELLEFLRTRFYRSPRVLKVMQDGAARIRHLFAALRTSPRELPEGHLDRIEDDGLERTICDYIAGMTDRYLHRATADFSADGE
ncbi:MAG: dNTP triphosphohydrolase [Planctomycetes bacterium]|nr:dNTP triphosphohydrolase [Planctomycetota bacterium]